MNKKIYFIFLISIFLIGTVLAINECGNEDSYLGTFKQDSAISLTQTCDDCSFVNLSKVQSPSSVINNYDLEMEENGINYNFTFNGTSQIGCYSYTVLGDPNGVNTAETIDFQITPSGFINTLGLYIVFLVIFGGIMILGFSQEEAWYIIISGMGFIMLGVYSINYGIVGFRDSFMTWGVGLFEIALGAILSIQAGIQKMYYD